jgi:hypothetical protein
LRDTAPRTLLSLAAHLAYRFKLEYSTFEQMPFFLFDLLPFQVANYNDVVACREQLDGGEITSVVLLNCGAMVSRSD